jgi:protein-tyrosine phosphatase
MSDFAIYPVPLSTGTVAISPIPGRSGAFEADLNTLLRWNPDLVLTMTTAAELTHVHATDLPMRLQDAGTDWLHLPIKDFGEPHGETAAFWPEAAKRAHAILDHGGKVLAHCYGGQGRSGMAIMRLMVERGITPDNALAQIRAIRPGAVETDAQRLWASQV